ncbi:phage tail spike protein [Floricoccus penangensis]|uniref:phage tail spike protein n=1 Tax=Floricoccus penangensis TaxID=1859475 RepID=UPI00203C6338|nr:phage tail spike protein [Floricoccus penangensis]URZ87558.1 phage tail protein [Floricoccus penangensis]
MKYPVLYNAYTTDFNSLGLGPMTNTISAKVTEERNGSFIFESEVIYNSADMDILKENQVIRADAGHNLKDQLFRIKRIVVDSKSKAKIYAEHVSYLTQELSLKPEVVILSKSGQSALTTWKNSIIQDNPLTVYSDIEKTASTEWRIDKVPNSRKALGGTASSIFENWGGEYKFDNYHISLLKKRGKTSNTLLAYGRNIIDLEQERNITSTYTSVYPYAVFKEGDSESILSIPEYTVDSKYIDSYPNRNILPVDFSSEFRGNLSPSISKLRELAKKYIYENNIGIPVITLKISFIELSKSADYTDIKPLEELNLCDDVNIIFPKLNINTVAQVTRVIWNVLSESYDEIEIGEKKSTLSNIIKNQQDKLKSLEIDTNSALLASNGINTVFYGRFGENGLGQPNASKVGDTWYKPNGEITEFYIWNGTIWELIMTTEGIPGLKESLKEIETKVEQGAKDAADATIKANEASKKALESAQKVDDSKILVDSAVRDSTEAKNKAVSTELIANKAKIDSLTAIAESKKIADSLVLTDKKAQDAINDANIAFNESQNAKNNATNALSEAKNVLDKFNNLSIGATNLILNSSLLEGMKKWRDWGGATGTREIIDISDLPGLSKAFKFTKTVSGGQYGYAQDDIKLLPNMSYTGSFWAKSLSGTVEVTLQKGNGGTDPWSSKELVVGESWTRLTYTWATGETTKDTRFYVGFQGAGVTTMGVLLAGFQLEQANTVSNWKPNPEDLQVQITNINGQLATKVSQTTFDSLNGRVNNQETSLTQTKNELSTKANKTDVDTLKSTVSSQQTQINQTSSEVKTKAEKSEVNTLTGSVNSVKSEQSIQAGKITSLTSKTDTQQSQISKLVQDYTGITSTMTKVQSDLNNFSVGSRNYLKGTSNPQVIKSNGSMSPNYQTTDFYEFTFDPKDMAIGDEYVLSYDWAASGLGGTFRTEINQSPYSFPVAKAEGTNAVTSNIKDITEKSGKVNFFYKMNSSSQTTKANRIRIRFDNVPESTVFTISNMRLVKGNQIVDWTPAPEDLSTVVEMSEVKQTISEIRTTVANKTDQSQFTQLANQFNTFVSNNSWRSVTGSIDLNDFKTAGTFFLATTVKANSPFSNYAYLQVSTSRADRIIQTIQADVNTSLTYTRYWNGTIWSEWKKIADSLDIAAVNSSITQEAGRINALITKTDNTNSNVTKLELNVNGLSSSVTNIKNDVENLNVGGRNYLRNGSFDNGLSYWNKTGDVTANVVNGVASLQLNSAMNYKGIFQTFKFPQVEETSVTISFDAKYLEAGKDVMTCGIHWRKNGAIASQSWTGDFKLTSEMKRYSFTYKVSNIDEVNVMIYGSGKQAFNFSIDNIKFEKGNKATDYSPAPEDLATVVEMSELQQTAKQIQSTVLTKANQSQVTQLADQLTSVVQKTDWQKVTASVDLNDYKITGKFFITGVRKNCPFSNWCYLQVECLDGGRIFQTIQADNDTSQTYKRTWNVNTANPNGYWSEWKRSADELDINNVKSLISQEADKIKLLVTKTDTTNTNVNKLQVDVTGINTTVAKVQTDLNGKASTTDFSTLSQKVNSIQTTVGNKAEQSQVTQLANQWTQTTQLVDGHNSQISSLGNSVNLRVTKGDVVNQINISPETILISGKKIQITGDTYIANGVIKTAHIQDASITNAKIGNISADKLTAGTINASNVNIINLNANNITAGTLTGPNLSINLTTGEVNFKKGTIQRTDGNFKIDITKGIIESFNSQGGFTIKDGGAYFSDYSLLNTGSKQFGSISYDWGIGSMNIYSGIRVRGKDGWTIASDNYSGGIGLGRVEGSGITGNSLGDLVIASGKGLDLSGGALYGEIIKSVPSICIGYQSNGANNNGDRIFINSEYVHIRNAYYKTTSSAPNVFVASDGALVRSTSASKYKTNIERTFDDDYGQKILQLPTATWMDKADKERYESDPEHYILPQRNFGMIAEDLAEAGLEMLVSRGEDGRIEGIQYDRIGPALIPVVKRLQDRVIELEKIIKKGA